MTGPYLVPSAKLSVLSEITKAPVRPPSGLLSAFPVFINAVFDGTNKYAAIGYNGDTNATLAEAYARNALAIEIVSWTMRLPDPLVAGNTLSFRFVVNDTPDAGMVITMGDGDQSGRADGSLIVPVDSAIAIEGIVGGTLTDVLVLGGVVGYRS